ncbi:LOW QUALITY PROTEIN: FYN-binding protein 1 [Rhinophrynus dorsalis]
MRTGDNVHISKKGHISIPSHESMDTNRNVKSLAAIFNSSPCPMESSERSTGPPALKGIHAKMAGFEKLSNSSSGVTGAPGIAPKKPVPGIKPATDDMKPSFVKTGAGVNRLAGSFHGNNKEPDKPLFPKGPGFKPPNIHKEEPKGQYTKPTANKPYMGVSSSQEHKFGGIKSSTHQPEQKENEEKLTFPKPSALKGLQAPSGNEIKPTFPKKPSFGGNIEVTPNENSFNKNPFVQKSYSSSQENKPINQTKEPPEANEVTSSSQTFQGVTLRSVGPKPIQSPFLKQSQEVQNEATKPNIAGKVLLNKVNQEGNSGIVTTKFPRVQSTFLANQVSTFQDKLNKQSDPSEPKRKPLPPPFKLGPAPQKPCRPPNVDLERLKLQEEEGTVGPMSSKRPVVPIFQRPTVPNKDHPDGTSTPCRCPDPGCRTASGTWCLAGPEGPPDKEITGLDPHLSMRNSKGVLSEQKSSALSTALPPLPPSHTAPAPPPPQPPPVNSFPGKQPAPPALPPSLPPRNIRATTEIQSDEENYDDVGHEGPSGAGDDMSLESDPELYEGIEEGSTLNRKQQDAKKEKEEKRRLEQMKKEQKEKEKKEQELRKRFKLTGLTEVLHLARACLDYKGGKNELTVKQGDLIEIIRITDNPEGKWLGRSKGCYGYIKTTMVNIDYDSLKRKKSVMHTPIHKEENDQEIYDDVGEQDSISNQSIGGNGRDFPPPPSDGDIYDGVEDDMNDGVSPMQSPSQEGDVYDDVGEMDFPPPPLESDIIARLKSSTLGRSPERDSKAVKKIEKEEKEFRKKFKYTDEITVLSTIQVLSSLTTKKFGSKDLPLKPGEYLDVIQHTNESTLLCRNKDGKYGYVLRSNTIDNDGEIYDDIGEDCIYDND